MQLRAPAPPVWMTVEEFLDWAPHDGQHWQLVDGVPLAMAPASVTHGAMTAEMGATLAIHLRQSGSPCRVVTAAGVQPRIQARHNLRIPDLAVTCSPPSADGAYLTDPVLVIELLSPSNQAETWANVWAYTSIPSVREILVLRTTTIHADLLRRFPDGSWPAEPEIIESGTIRLGSIDMAFDLAEAYRTTRFTAASPGGAAP